ncbi:protein CHLOROPLAST VESICULATION [Andrographis paniculata]|uniref:protein CHLOROPLAST VESICULATION n=1 Tax=Andrographis paniculata TaxID=175694 RepID=UPI0021E998D8|nr:protein CHLOROPLAST VESICULATION [Andrographis paniculata]
MAFSTIYCSLNLSSPPSPSNPTPPIPTSSQLPSSQIWEGKWKSGCLVGLTCCAIIGLEIGSFGAQESAAAATDLQSESARIVRVQRWSDRRGCQPWRANSLETIVPENLPRPSARRRWEATGFHQAAPPLPAPVPAGFGAKSCFNL